MEYVNWSDKYLLALPEIDAQHKGLFSIINELWICVIKSGSKENMAELIDRLEDYTRTHFAEEETLLREHQYPAAKLDEHIRQHQEFVAKIDWARGKLLNEPSSALQLLSFLREWLAGHINGSDRQYAEFLGKVGPLDDRPFAGLMRVLRGDE